ncbi:MAG: mercuric transport protein MerTP [Bacteroidetes bacterium]|nr:mercuric transport protein MerTP [Bacteroidota bacterium]
MSTIKSGGKTWMAGLLTASVASLCCITPVIALFSGATGFASTFSWLEPYRSCLISLSIAALAFAWYQKLKPQKTAMDCACEEDKPSFWQTKTFLGIVTVLAFLLMAFPKYAHIFYPKTEKKEIVIIDKSNIQQVKLNIKGMTCEACSETINLALSKVPGVLEYKTEFANGSSTIKFDNSKTVEQAIINAVNKTGFKVIDVKNVQQP